MPPFRSRTALLALTLFTGCKAGDQGQSPPPPPPNTKQAAALAANVPVRIHLTGLLLIVPPPATGETNVLVPKHGGHAALFGVPFDAAHPPSATGFCLGDTTTPKAPSGALAAGMCYIDLDKWDVAPIGNGPANTSHVDLEKDFGVLNVTSGSGGQKVVLASIQHLLTSRIVFNTGAPRDSCSLASWQYKPKGGAEAPRNVSSVLDWDMMLPAGYALVFTRKAAPHDKVSMSLGSSVAELVLAQLRPNEVKDLPPAHPIQTTNAPGPSEAAHDFDVFYDLLGIQASTPDVDPGRPLPHFKTVHSNVKACQIDITLSPARGDTIAGVGVKTFLCIPASAELGP